MNHDDVPRKASHYWLSIHAKQMRRERNIPMDLIGKAITDGELVNGKPNESETRMFTLEWPGRAHNIGVVVEPDTGKVRTVEDHYMHED